MVRRPYYIGVKYTTVFNAYGILKRMMGGSRLSTPQKKMSQHKNRLGSVGFTIIETLIVLAITGVMFVSIAGLVSGRQSKAQFTQGINSIRDEIEQVINDVQSGYYPRISLESAGRAKEFMTIGKAIQFGIGSDPERYAVYSLITERDAKEIGESGKTVQVVSDATQINPLKYGLTTKWMRVVGGADIGAVGFVTYFTENNRNLLYGSQTTQIVPIRPLSLSAETIGPSLVSSYDDRNPSRGIEVCFDGGIGQSGLITIGGSKGSNSVTLAIKNGNNCER